MRATRLSLTIVALFVGVLGYVKPAHAQWTADKGVFLKGTIVTMDEQGTVKKNGAVLIRGGKVEAILSGTAKPPEGAIVIDTKGYIFPGMLNLHNHIAYNFLPLYSVPKHYDNRDQWPTGASYEEKVNNPKNLVTSPSYYDRQTEALKYAEIKALVGGETAIQGSPQDAGTSTTLVRNVELPNFGLDKVGQRGLSIDGMFIEDLAHNQASIRKLTGWFFHLSEGISQYSRDEYYNPSYKSTQKINGKNRPGLKNLDLVTESLIGIHCTALKEEDYADWKHITGKGAKVVWSPLSNMLLYGKTTDILAARRQGATISIGTDWSPSGSKNLLWELKVADQVNEQKFNKALSSKELVQMVTSNPAKLLGWDQIVGQIKVGMTADLVVVDDHGGSDPYRALIDAVESKVQLVLIGGDPLYGDEKWLAATKTYPDGKHYEKINELAGRPKALDLKRKGIPEGEQSFDEIKKALLDALKYDPKALADRLNQGRGEGPLKYKQREALKTWLAGALKKRGKAVPAELLDPKAPLSEANAKLFLSYKFPNAKPIAALDSLYQENDPSFFAGVRSNLHFVGANAALDLKPFEKYTKAATPGLVGGVTGN